MEYDYGHYAKRVRKHFPHLKKQYYLDYTGASIPTKGQLANNDLIAHLLCNSHSVSKCSKNSEQIIEGTRDQVLKFFGTSRSSYSVIFTQSATHSLHILSESFPKQNESTFYYSQINHNSVLGMRRLFSRFKVLKQQPFHDFKAFANLDTTNSFTLARQVHDPAKTYDLVAFPAEENFAGAKANLNIAKYFETNHSIIRETFKNYEGQHQSFVVLDMAAYVPTNPINLTEVAPAFAVGSFYKMFGFPTGIGFLIVRHDVSHILIKNYFGGGSLVMAAVGTDFVQFRERPDTRFEDGTQNFYGIAGVSKGLNAINSMGGVQMIQQHVDHLRNLCIERMKELKYSNGQSLIQLYEISGSQHGGIIAFNLFFKNGTLQGYKSPLMRSIQYNLQIRAGSMCNPGAIQFYIDVSDQIIIQSTASRLSCSDDLDTFNGKVLGALRVSFGWGSVHDDVEQLLNWLKSEIK